MAKRNEACDELRTLMCSINGLEITEARIISMYHMYLQMILIDSLVETSSVFSSKDQTGKYDFVL